MGTMTFLLPAGLGPDVLRELERACVSGGPDNMPWPTEVRVQDGSLTVRRAVDESGYLVAPWLVDGAGRLMGSTSTLMERSLPYQFQVELARGKVNQVRCQAADWRAGGLHIPPDLNHQIQQSSLAFGHALTELPSPNAGLLAQDALRLAYQAAEALVQTYMDQVFQIRHQRQSQLDTTLGCYLSSTVPEGEAAAMLVQTCNGVCLPLPWHEVEPIGGSFRWDAQDALLDWADAQGLPISAGPLIDFSSARLPEWLWYWERDVSSLASFMCNYVETAVRRYHRRVQRWYLTSASNCASVLALSEDELLWLTVRLAEAARQVDSGLDLVVGIAQPWGEYMAQEDRSHSPFIFADTLIRSGLNLSSLDVEIVMGATPRGSYCRDLLELSRLLDLYALLGVPLRVTLGHPSAPGTDPRGDPELRAAAGCWRDSTFGLSTQAQWAELFTALALCKPYVQGVQWSHLSDTDTHLFPFCGLIDASGRIKPVFHRLRQLREQHLR